MKPKSNIKKLTVSGLFMAISFSLAGGIIAQESATSEHRPLQLAQVLPESMGVEENEVALKLKKVLGDLPILEVHEEKFSGLFVIMLADGSKILSNKEVTTLIVDSQNNGSQILTISDGDITDRTGSMQLDFVKKSVDSIKGGINYKADNEKHSVSVFIDPACPYCQKMHKEINEYLEAGISVRFLPYPVLSENSFSVMHRILSLPSEKQGPALSTIEAHLSSHGANSELDWNALKLPEGTDEVHAQLTHSIDVARAIGSNGTPNIITEKGHSLNGYVPANALLEALNELKN